MRRTWTIGELAHACDIMAHGLRDRTPFSGNPAFIEAMETTANLLRGDASKVRKIQLSARRDGTYLLIKVKESE